MSTHKRVSWAICNKGWTIWLLRGGGGVGWFGIGMNYFCYYGVRVCMIFFSPYNMLQDPANWTSMEFFFGIGRVHYFFFLLYKYACMIFFFQKSNGPSLIGVHGFPGCLKVRIFHQNSETPIYLILTRFHTTRKPGNGFSVSSLPVWVMSSLRADVSYFLASLGKGTTSLFREKQGNRRRLHAG